MDPLSILVFLNSDIKKRLRIIVQGSVSLVQIQAKCIKQFKIKPDSQVILYDMQGEIISEDDCECISENEVLFCSKGEGFTKLALKAVYKKIRTLGKGGFGTVKLYKDRLSKQLVAIKLIEIKSLLRSDAVIRVYKELQVLKELKHSGIVKFLNVFQSEGFLCFVMEYLQGGELKKYVQEKRGLNDQEASLLGLQIAEAIRFCHNSCIIHRDLKPENLIFRDKSHQSLIIVDFGIAGLLQSGRSDSSTAGSLYYLAPEVLTGNDTSSKPELDIWSLGCVLLFMLTGEKPFPGTSRPEVISNIISGRFCTLNRPIWSALISGCLQTDPFKRWKIMEIIQYLEKIKNNEISQEDRKSFNKSLSLRIVKTPEPIVKLPVIKGTRHVTRPKKRTFIKSGE
jgi:serine/threonine protein kinase